MGKDTLTTGDNEGCWRMGKRIGILTQYYKSSNYGGNLQAYALCKALNALGYTAEQIKYDHYATTNGQQVRPSGSRLKKLLNPKLVWQYALYSTRHMFRRLVLGKSLDQRNTAVSKFNQGEIPHGDCAYTPQSIRECTEYDAYIVGSDQVWNPDWYQMAYFLDFVPQRKKKFSYAASIGKKELTPEQREVFREKLADFAAVSVREQDAVELLENLSPVPVVQTLDPTLLLTREQWDEVCSERLIPGKYIFTYFLGADENQRKVAAAFAGKKKLPIVTLPFLEGSFRKCDVFFGDKKLYDISPADFISLIKHAEYVLTDSFHACVFSSIYQKEFFAFHRLGHAGMGGRLYSLTKLFHSEDHFCDTKERANLGYIQSCEPIDYNKPHAEFDQMRMQSAEFLIRNLSDTV